MNLFLFDVPRLSVDLDLNYIGQIDREAMLAERPQIEAALQAVCSREGLGVQRLPDEHAGGKWSLRYASTLGQGGNLAVDVNFMFRVPLWPVLACDSYPVGSYQAQAIPVLDMHELTAGKLTALLSRRTARDLFDAHLLLRQDEVQRARLRLAFVVYGAMSRKDWRTVSADDVRFEAREVESQLFPMLRRGGSPAGEPPEAWSDRLVEQCRTALESVLPFAQSEREFLDRLLDHGEIAPELLTADDALAERIRRQPGLEWKALNVRQWRGQ